MFYTFYPLKNELARKRRAPVRQFLFLKPKFLVLLPKASQGVSLAAFLASIQEILSFYETAKHF